MRGSILLACLACAISFCSGRRGREYGAQEEDGVESVVERFACLDQKGGLTVEDHMCNGLVGKATFRNAINETGWSNLEVETEGSYSDVLQAYAAGALEGNATGDLIYWHWLNTVAGYCDDVQDYCDRLRSFLRKNLEWMEAQIHASPQDPFWHQIHLVLVQLTGLSDGYYGSLRPPTISLDIDNLGFLMFQLGGDLEDIEQALNKPTWALKKVLGSGSCSAFIKIVGGDIFFAHDTWSTYQSMLRILKLYKFPFRLSSENEARVPGTSMAFSSYPGTIPSIDDFYSINTGLAVTETTIGNNNKALLKTVTPTGGVLTWMRGPVANRLATSAQQWTSIFGKKNSGTYNNQWMVIDYKKVANSESATLPDDGVFWVLEQIPGTVKSADMTHFLKNQGFWPSYNVPYFPEIFNKSGWPQQVAKFGDWFSYDKTPRALIFKRDEGKVQDMASLTSLMRYNKYTTDPLSRCKCKPPYSAENAIAARCDLNPKNGSYPIASLGHRSHGAIDMKATNSAMMKRLEFLAISGPTADSLPPFRWSHADFRLDTPHFAHPDLWDFKPIVQRWKSFP